MNTHTYAHAHAPSSCRSAGIAGCSDYFLLDRWDGALALLGRALGFDTLFFTASAPIHTHMCTCVCEDAPVQMHPYTCAPQVCGAPPKPCTFTCAHAHAHHRCMGHLSSHPTWRASRPQDRPIVIHRFASGLIERRLRQRRLMERGLIERGLMERGR